MTGAIVGVDITGRDGVTLRDKWDHGPTTYLGLMTKGFPNLFMITGPGSPSVLSNMMVSIEQHVDWITDALVHLRDDGFDSIEPTELAETRWVQHSNEFADLTLMPTANSWYMGVNVPGKPQVFLPYPGGVDRYRAACNEVVERDYLGFVLDGPGGHGRQRRHHPRTQARRRGDAGHDGRAGPAADRVACPSRMPGRSWRRRGAMSPPGPEVGEVVDGTLPGADGQHVGVPALPAGVARPTPDRRLLPRWRLGARQPHLRRRTLPRSVRAVRRHLRVRQLSPRSRRHRFPAAADDGLAAVQWIAEHAEELGGVPGQLAVAGWSAGANVATVTCQQAEARRRSGDRRPGAAEPGHRRRHGHRRRTRENADGYILTRGLMEWFWDHYCDPGDRLDPKASPARADDLAGLPPAMVVTCQFDPLRDEGDAYAACARGRRRAGSSSAVRRPDPHLARHGRCARHRRLRPNRDGRRPEALLRRQRYIRGLTPDVTRGRRASR